MPYIKDDAREILQQSVDHVIGTICNQELFDKAGLCNYAITRIVHECLSGLSYSDINTAMGVFESAKQEYYRRVAQPYENQKRYENGDVF